MAVIPKAFLPESLNFVCWSAGLLTRFGLFWPSHPYEQWRFRNNLFVMKLTAAGTV